MFSECDRCLSILLRCSRREMFYRLILYFGGFVELHCKHVRLLPIVKKCLQMLQSLIQNEQFVDGTGRSSPTALVRSFCDNWDTVAFVARSRTSRAGCCGARMQWIRFGPFLQPLYIRNVIQDRPCSSSQLFVLRTSLRTSF